MFDRLKRVYLYNFLDGKIAALNLEKLIFLEMKLTIKLREYQVIYWKLVHKYSIKIQKGLRFLQEFHVINER